MSLCGSIYSLMKVDEKEMSKLDELAQRLENGDKRALARAITIVESRGPQATHLIKRLFGKTGKAHIIGVTGSPGVGKSTLVDALITCMRQHGKKVAILAVDPSSPFTGGAILGDRIRMQGHTLDKDVYIRSMANRGHQGGIALATYDAVRMLEAYGFDIVIIETVGVGQSELAIAQAADTTVLVLMPGSGDDIQAIKSGIMEIGDIFVVNKGDLPGANKSAAEITASLELSAHPNEEMGDFIWHQPVHLAIAETGEGVDKLYESTVAHKAFLEESGMLKERRKARIKAELAEILAEIAQSNLENLIENSSTVQDTFQHVVSLTTDPHSAALAIMKEFRESPSFL